MKALEKDRSRRYDTANGFAADVLRHLANEPVLAAPPGRIYLLRKFARKHRGALAAAGLVVLTLIAGIVGTAWQAVQANRARQAESERATSEEAAKRDALQVGEQLRVARDELRYSLYAARSKLIEGAWDEHNITRVRDLLDEQVPKDGERDLRGFEWHYWDRRADKELGVFPLPRFFGFGTFSADGGTLLGVVKPDDHSSVTSTERVGMWESGTGRLVHEVETHDAQERKRIGFSGPVGFTANGTAFASDDERSL